ncbi:DUF4190 domain-containing protein [Demequina sp.]|uniref:DUF4190 domain-containing protein n=1 Tax=Demequina sp. TaxID=2050685 RepID=UPI003A8B0720
MSDVTQTGSSAPTRAAEPAPWDAILAEPTSASAIAPGYSRDRASGASPAASTTTETDPPAHPSEPSPSLPPTPKSPDVVIDDPEPTSEPDGEGAEPGEPTATEPEPHPDREWMGIAAYASALLLLSPVAIVLGHLGISAARKGRARHRSFAVAGAVLGWIGLVATGVGLYFLLTDRVTADDIDIQAQQDVSAVGAAAATYAVETGQLPEVSRNGDSYTVAGETLDAHLTGLADLYMSGTTASDWCFTVGYKGGNEPSFSYSAMEGMFAGPCPGVE